MPLILGRTSSGTLIPDETPACMDCIWHTWRCTIMEVPIGGTAATFFPTFFAMCRGSFGVVFRSRQWRRRFLEGADAGILFPPSPLKAPCNAAASAKPDCSKASSTRSCRAFFCRSLSLSYSFVSGCASVSLYGILELRGEARLDGTAIILSEEHIISEGVVCGNLRSLGGTWNMLGLWQLSRKGWFLRSGICKPHYGSTTCKYAIEAVQTVPILRS
jgi:hypothetical protein